MTERVVEGVTSLASLPTATVLLAMLPILELRGALPVALLNGMPLVEAYVLAVAGNMLPIPFIIWLLGPATNFVRRWRRGDRFVEWLFARTRRKGKQIELYEFWGLMIFVAIPLPGTGAWTGAMAGHVFGMKPHRTFLACFWGVVIAGIIVAVATLGAQQSLRVLF